MKKKSKILITGSCGFIFSYFIRHVLRTTKDYTLVSVDKYKEGLSLDDRIIFDTIMESSELRMICDYKIEIHLCNLFYVLLTLLLFLKLQQQH